MRKSILLLIVIAFFSTIKAQTIYKDYIDGQVYFAINHELYANITNGNAGQKQTVLNKLEYFNFLDDLVKKYNITKVNQPFSNATEESILRICKVHFADIEKVNELLLDLQRIDGLYNVEKVPLYKTFATPNDPYYGTLGGVDWNWYLDVINASGAWNIAYGNSSISVGIVDGSILNTHPDLSGAITTAYDGETQTTGSSAPPSNTYEWSHGTHCAGLIGAVTNNSTGIASIGSGIKLYTAKAGKNSDGSLYYIAEGLNWLATQPIKVLSLSFGGPSSSTNEQDWYSYMHDTKNIVILAAAGNDGVTDLLYPAAYTDVVAVASTDQGDTRSDFSNYGTWVDIAAPGGYSTQNAALLSTTACEATDASAGYAPADYGISGKYNVMQGTSMATPLAAGLVGLMRSLNPALSATEIETCLFNSCVDVGTFVEHGRINALAAMQCVQSTLTGAPIANFSGTPTSIVEGAQVVFTDISNNGGNTITSRSWSFAGGTPSTSTATNPTITYNTAGTYNVSLTVTNSEGSDSETKTGYITVSDIGTAFTLDFEASANFAVTFDPWTTNDVDQTITYGIDDGSGGTVAFTHSGEAMSFIAFNPASCSPVQTDPAPHGGSRFGACFASIPSEGTTNNDWLISPKVQLGTNSSFKVWVKSHTDQYGLERYKIGVSTTTNSPASFTTISSGTYETAPTTWTEKIYSLANYNNQQVYVGINCVSSDAFIFMVDDIEINTTTTGINNFIVENVNLYPNPTQGVVHISGITNFDQIEIVDVNGKIVKTINNFTNTIDVSELAKGNYAVKIILTNTVIVKRFALVN